MSKLITEEKMNGTLPLNALKSKKKSTLHLVRKFASTEGIPSAQNIPIVQASKKLTPFRKAILRLKRNNLAIWGVYGLALALAYILLVPALSPHAYSGVCSYAKIKAEPPSLRHWFGTDRNGKDVFVLVACAGRISVLTSFFAASVAAIIGTLIGAWAGLCGGWQEDLLMRFADLVDSIPSVFVAMLLVPHFEQAFFFFFLSLSFLQWVQIARMVRGQTLALKEGGFIEAAEISGVGKLRLLIKHIIPNVAGMVGILLPQMVQTLVATETFYAYFGMGVQPPFVSWGRLIKEGGAPHGELSWEAWPPVYAFVFTLFSLNLLSLGLRDALDPKDR